MSLINDALKRAQETQRQSPPPLPTGTHFLPVAASNTQWARRGLGLALPVVFALVALAGLLLVWQWKEKNAQSPSAGAARAQPPSAESPQPAVVSAAALPSAGSVPPRAEPTAPPEPQRPDASPGPASPVPITPPAAKAPPAPAQAVPLKLQAIIFDPTRPSAMISGQTVFVGDRLGKFRLTAITAASVTLANANQTNVLSLRSE